jgi:hypothetical protein
MPSQLMAPAEPLAVGAALVVGAVLVVGAALPVSVVVGAVALPVSVALAVAFCAGCWLPPPQAERAAAADVVAKRKATGITVRSFIVPPYPSGATIVEPDAHVSPDVRAVRGKT